jgi:hypothetical protein
MKTLFISVYKLSNYVFSEILCNPKREVKSLYPLPPSPTPSLTRYPSKIRAACETKWKADFIKNEKLSIEIPII